MKVTFHYKIECGPQARPLYYTASLYMAVLYILTEAQTHA